MKALKRNKSAQVPTPDNLSYHAERHLRKFSMVTSHELVNLLGAIVGELDYGLSSQMTDTKIQAMEISLSAAEKALTIARNLRYFAVHTRLDVHSADLGQLVLDAADALENDLQKRGILLSIMVDASTYARVDCGAISQIVLNLLLNAAFAMPDGGKISVTLKQLPKTIELCVSDTGQGIDPKKLEHIFEPYFFSEGRSRTESLGLGLAVTKALVEAHGGEISVESKINSGTTFLISLPFDPSLPRPTPYAEKRRFKRVSATFPVEVAFENHREILQSELITLSVGGCFIILPEREFRVKNDEKMSLKIHYFKNASIEIPRARIANLCRMGSQSGMGIEFEDISAKAKKVLAALVKSNAS